MNFFFTSVAGFNVTVIYKNGFMRKFLFFALSAIFTAGTPAGCNTDYNAISYFVWVNDSDHKITLFVESDLGCEFKNEVILPNIFREENFIKDFKIHFNRERFFDRPNGI